MSRIAVVGDGWSALLAVGYAATCGHEVLWLSGSGARLTAPLPCLEDGRPAEVWLELARRLGMNVDKQAGSFVREFRNKTFREPDWAKASETAEKIEAKKSSLWGPEPWFVPLSDCRLGPSFGDLEEEIRKQLLGKESMRRYSEMPLQAFEPTDSGAVLLTLGNGEKIECDELVLADRWSSLAGIEGLPKPLSFARRREPTGVLQAVFSHVSPLGGGTPEGFFGPIAREAGEEQARNVWGYFLENGRKSVWTLFLGSDESEDNHEIAKKLRRMKQALDRMATAVSWLPEGKADFVSTVESEQVRFEETIVFTAGEPPAERIGSGVKGTLANRIHVLADGYGPSHAAEYFALALGDRFGTSGE